MLKFTKKKTKEVNEMANIKSQVKRIRTNEKARQRNAAYKSSMRTAIKKVQKACADKDVELAKSLLPLAISKIDRSVAKGIQHKRTAARQKSHLMTLVNSL